MGEDLSAFAKKRKTKKIRRYVFLGVLLVLLLGTALYLAMENYFVVSEVSVLKSSIYKTEEISAQAAIQKGTPLYKLDKKKIVSGIQEHFPYLEDVKVNFKLPDKVRITYKEEFGEFALSMGAELFAVDGDLNVLAKESKSSEIERISLVCGDVKRCIVGEKLSFIDEDTAPILLDLVKELEAKEVLASIRQIDVSDQFDIRLDYEGKFEIAMGDHEDINLKLSMVKEVIRDLGADATGRIDIADPNNAYVKLNDPVS